MASSAFSFHCMICFEEFDPHTHYPVVLPCGHTYVCITCANRLDKCMECRTSLSAPVEPSPSPSPVGLQHRHHQKENRYVLPKANAHASSYYEQKQQLMRQRLHRPQLNYRPQLPPSPPQQRKRLPLPKNVVLLSLIQASEPARRRSAALAAAASSSQHSPRSPSDAVGGSLSWRVDGVGEGVEVIGASEHERSPSQRRDDTGGTGERRSRAVPSPARAECPSPLFADETSTGEPYDDEEQKIRVGTHVANGPCGTYAVAAKEGLIVYPTLPENFAVLSRDEKAVERLVRSSYESRTRRRQESAKQELQMPVLESSQTWVENHDEDSMRDQGGVSVEVEVTSSPKRNGRGGGTINVGDIVRSPSSVNDVHRSQKAARQSQSSPTPSNEGTEPIVRLRYGDRVQVVSMEAEGWMQLARGYGYIKTENDKQLVKVGGTNDMACQLEAVLHELSVERTRLKQEQKQLERVAAGMMIDLQSSLHVDNDLVVVPAPEGMPRSESELCFMLKNTKFERQASKDDITFRPRSDQLLTPGNGTDLDDSDMQHIRSVKSDSPSRSPKVPTVHCSPKASPQSRVSTPTRVNWRTGMSGHRALTSSHSHPHDFLENRRDTRRSMSSHSGLTPQKSPVKVPHRTLGKRSIY